jgi:hypothetical protein
MSYAGGKLTAPAGNILMRPQNVGPSRYPRDGYQRRDVQQRLEARRGRVCAAGAALGSRAVQVFWGGEPQVQSERDFLAQLEGDLLARDLKGIILANFHTGNGSRQVDFLIATARHVCHVELKNYEGALEGSRNGAWQARRPDGTAHVIDRQNPYDQAFGCKTALSDDMASLAARDAGIPRPAGGKKFFTRFDSVVCVFPRLADESDVPSDFKVRTLGYREFFAFLASPGRHPGWSPLHWETFIRDLGLMNAAGQDTEAMLQTTAGELTAEYRQRFGAYHRSGLHELVPLPVLHHGTAVAPARLPGVVEAAGHLQVIGPSGCGKSHLLKHSLLAMGEHMLPVIVDAGMYEGRLSLLIDRSVARFTTSGTRALLRAAAISGQRILLAVDGFNECPERFREALTGDMSAFCLQTGACTIITTQARVPLPPGLVGAEACSAGLTRADRRAILASYGAEDIVPLCDAFTTPYDLSIAAECAAELRGPVTRGALFASFIRRRLSSTRTPAVVRDTVRQLALAMSQTLTTWLPLDEVWRISEEHLAGQAASVGVIDEVLACTLTRTSQGRLSFTHELLGRFLALEALRRDYPEPSALARELRLPRYRDLTQLAAELETGHARLAVLLNSLADHPTYTAALRGEAGRAAGRTVRDAASGLLARVTSGLAATTFTVHSRFETAITDGYELGEGDRALIEAIGKVAGDGQFTAEIGALLDATDAACQRSADKQQPGGGRRPGASLIVSAVLNPSFTTPGRPRAAARILLGAARTGWSPADRTYRPGAEPADEVRVIAALLDGATPQSYSRLLLVCYLLQAARTPQAAALVPQVLRLCWASKVFHIRLDSLCMARGFAVAVEGHPAREQIAGALLEIDTGNWGLSSMLVDALHAYGLIEPLYDEDQVRAQVSQALSNPADQESRELAYSIVSRQFEDVIAAPYESVVEGLDPQQRTMLYTLASLGSTHYSFWNDWLLQHLVESRDPRALPAYERWATTLGTDSGSPQETARCYALAVQGWAQLMPQPPRLADSGSDARAAWQCYGAIIFWMHRPAITPAETCRQCTPHWQRLRAGLLHAAADPLYWLENASQFQYRDKDSLVAAIMETFPDEIRPILEWSIQHPGAMESVFPPMGDDRGTLISLLATVGDTDSGNLLRRYVDDPDLGDTAITALKALNGRVGQGLAVPA